ncbi:MAG: DegV family EDD domain-containing protein, partial [Lachnospiraceae bacterium]|nr:DegV family EDD domain-containing protein [Lachnospiraceae bacterium]
KAAEMAKNGASPAEIVQKCEELIPKVEASFVVDSIEYLHKGGRCSSVAALGANLFKIKPAIEVIDGGMQAGKKYRGNINKAITTYVEDRLGGREDIDMSRIFITHTRCDQSEVDKVRELIYQYCPDMQEVLETVAGATITTHCGPGTLGILFLRK